MTSTPIPHPRSASSQPGRRNAVLRVVLLVLGCAVAGVLLTLVMIGWLLEEREAAGLPDTGGALHPGYILLQVAMGLLALATLPFTLRHDPREARPEPIFPGPQSALICGLISVACGAPTPLGVPASLVALVSLLSRRSLGWGCAAGVAFLTLGGLDLWFAPGTPPAGWPEFVLLIGIALLAAVIGLARGRRRERTWRLQAQAEAARVQAREREDRARQDERLRIARDMHDTLSHRLSLVAVYAGALAYRDDLDPGTVRAQAATIREQAELGVADLRTVLLTLRQPAATVDPRSSVQDLVATAQAAGDAVTLRWAPDVEPGALDRLPTAGHHAVHRTVLEGLTNARKHAPGSPVQVRVATPPGLVTVTISNPCPAPVEGPAAEIRPAEVPVADGTPARSPGLGLLGLAERAEAIGGRLEVARGAEFVVRLEVPCPS